MKKSAHTATQIVTVIPKAYPEKELAELTYGIMPLFMVVGFSTSLANIEPKRKSKLTFARCADGN